MTLPALKDRIPEIELIRPLGDAEAKVLTPGALAFLGRLVGRFQRPLENLLAERQRRHAAGPPDFDPRTESIRTGDWRVAPIPSEVADRRTEITGPVSRKMVINALNSGAQVYMADFEDSTAPGWGQIIDGQRNLRDAVRGTISLESNGKQYRLNDETAVLMVRPRGLHLPEHHLRLAGRPVPAALVDFGLFLYHNHAALTERGSRPFFYLPKLEHGTEARWWNDVIEWSEASLGVAPGTTRVTVLIETLPAVFQMHEILHALKDRILGLNCGRWDYIFSYIKTFADDPTRVLPDREQVTMTTPFLAAYSRLLIATCHRRGAFAMGGMAAQIPVRGDEAANAAALERVRADKQREAEAGHDGTWVAHPGLEPVAREEFDAVLNGPNQIDRTVDADDIDAAKLTEAPEGTVTEAGVRGNLRVATQYLAAWLGGNGCVPINHLMEDAATAEISRAQLWQWRRHDARLDDGRQITDELLRGWLDAETASLRAAKAIDPDTLATAAALVDDLVFAPELAPFITLPAYQRLVGADTGPTPTLAGERA